MDHYIKGTAMNRVTLHKQNKERLFPNRFTRKNHNHNLPKVSSQSIELIKHSWEILCKYKLELPIQLVSELTYSDVTQMKRHNMYVHIPKPKLTNHFIIRLE